MERVGRLQDVTAQMRVLLAQHQKQALGSRHLTWPRGIERPWKEEQHGGMAHSQWERGQAIERHM